VHIFKATTVKFGVRARTWATVPAPNFVKIAKGGIVHWGKFLPKIRNFPDSELLKAHISIPIMLKFHLRESINDTKFRQIAQGACRYCIASGVMHIDFCNLNYLQNPRLLFKGNISGADCMPLYIAYPKLLQEAQLSQRGRAMLRVYL